MYLHIGAGGVSMSETKMNMKNMITEIGVLPVGSPYGTFNQEEEYNLTDVSIEDLDKMCRVDGTARALYNILSLPIRSTGWTVTPSEDGQEEASFINALFTEPPYRGGMSTPMDYVISVATKAIRQGFVLWEKVYRVGDIKYFVDGKLVEKKNAILLKKLAHRPSEQITFKTDANGGLAGAVQRTYYKNKLIEANLPVEKIIVFTYNKHENSLYGESALLPAYYHYDKKHKLYYVAHMAYFLNAIPPRIGKYPCTEDSNTVNNFKLALRELGTKSVVTMPVFPSIKGQETPQYEIENLESGRSLADFTPLINHHNTEMSKSILAQFLELGTNGKGGAFALSADQSDMFLMSLESVMADIAYTFNAFLIPQLIDLNFGTGNYPEFSFLPLSDSKKAIMAETFKALVNTATTQLTDEFILSLEKQMADEFGLSIDYQPIEEHREELKQLRMEAEKAELERRKQPSLFDQFTEEQLRQEIEALKGDIDDETS